MIILETLITITLLAGEIPTPPAPDLMPPCVESSSDEVACWPIDLW